MFLNSKSHLSELNLKEIRVTNKFSYLLGFSAEVSTDGLQNLVDHPDVISIEKDWIVLAHTAQGIPLMNPLEERNNYSGANLSVAIVDTGIDYTHPKLGNGGFPERQGDRWL